METTIGIIGYFARESKDYRRLAFIIDIVIYILVIWICWWAIREYGIFGWGKRDEEDANKEPNKETMRGIRQKVTSHMRNKQK